MKTLEFFKAMPKLCAAKDADRASWVIEEVFKAELAGGTPFDRNASDEANPENRLYYAFVWKAADEEAKEQCKRLAKILLYSHYLDFHGEKYYEPLIEAEYTVAKEVEKSSSNPNIKAIAEVMSADEALVSFWSE